MTNPVDIWQSKLKDASPYTAKSCATLLSTLGFGGRAKGRQSSLTLGPLAIESRALTRELSRYNTSREHSAPQYKIEALQAYLWDYFSNSIKMMLQRPSSQVFHADYFTCWQLLSTSARFAGPWILRSPRNHRAPGALRAPGGPGRFKNLIRCPGKPSSHIKMNSAEDLLARTRPLAYLLWSRPW